MIAIGYGSYRFAWFIVTFRAGTVDYEVFGLAYLLTGLDEVAQASVEGALFGSIFVAIKLSLFAPLYYLSLRFLGPAPAKLLPGSEWTAVAVFAVAVLGETSTIFFVDATPCAVSDAQQILFSKSVTWLGLLVVYIVPLVLSPVLEEVQFRGLLYQLLRRRGALFRLLLTSALFCYVHLVNRTGSLLPYELLTSLLLQKEVAFNWLPGALVLGYAREVSGGISMPILMHVLYNVFFVVLGLFMVAVGTCG